MKKEAHIYLPAEVFNKVKSLAEKERRTLNGQILVMIEKQMEKETNPFDESPQERKVRLWNHLEKDRTEI